MDASPRLTSRNPFSDPTRLWGMGILTATAAWAFVPAMVAPWRAGALTPELMRTLLVRGVASEAALLGFPIGLGALVLLFRPSALTRMLDAFGNKLERWRASVGSGKFARFVVRPFVLVSTFLWGKTAGIAHPDWRTGVRVTLQTYIVGLFLFLLFTAAMILLALIIIGLVFALISSFMGGGAGGAVVSALPRVVKSRRTSDWLGEKVDHFDESGQKVAESRPQSDWMGEKVVHTAAGGEVLGESRQHSDLLGEKTDHYKASGEHAGESRARSDWLGEKVDHYNEAGEHVGESRPNSDWLGSHVRHEGSAPVELLAEQRHEEEPDESANERADGGTDKS